MSVAYISGPIFIIVTTQSVDNINHICFIPIHSDVIILSGCHYLWKALLCLFEEVLGTGLENEKKIQSVHSEQNRYFNVSVPAFLMYYYRSETG